MQAGGYIVTESLPDRSAWKALRAEAARGIRTANLSNVTESDATEIRGGNPARRFLQISGGEAQDAFYRSRGVSSVLSDLCSAPVVPSGSRGTYSYYVRPNHHLALHRDIEFCDVAVLTCICSPASAQEGGLCLYPSRCGEFLSTIRAEPNRGLVRVVLRAGQTIVLLGGIVPHLVKPVPPGQIRVVSVLCYRAVTS
jgi:hypothetical protein